MSRSTSPDRVPLLQEKDDDRTPDLIEASDVANTISPGQSVDAASTVSLSQFAGAASTVSPSGPVNVNATAMSSSEAAGVADQILSGRSRENTPASLLVVSTTEIFMLICDYLSNGSNKKVLRNLMLCSKTTSIAVDYLWGRHHVWDIYPLLRLLPVKEQKNSNTGRKELSWEDPDAMRRADNCRDRVHLYASKIERLVLCSTIIPRNVLVEEGILESLFAGHLAADNDRPFFPRLRELRAESFIYSQLRYLPIFALKQVPLRYIYREGPAEYNPISLPDGQNRWPSLWSSTVEDIVVDSLTQAELEATAQIASLKMLRISGQSHSLTNFDGGSQNSALIRIDVECPFEAFEPILTLVPPDCDSIESFVISMDLPQTSAAPPDASTDIIVQRLADRFNSNTELTLDISIYKRIESGARDSFTNSLTITGFRPWAKFSALHTLHMAIPGEVAIDNDSLVKLTLPLQNLKELGLTGRTTSRTTPDVLPPLIKSLKNLKSLELGFDIEGFRGDNGRSPDDIPEHIDLDREITLDIDPKCSSQIGEHHERLFNFLARILPGEQHYIGLSEWEVYPEWDDLVDRHIKQRKARYGPQADLYDFSWDDARKGMEYP